LPSVPEGRRYADLFKTINPDSRRSREFPSRDAEKQRVPTVYGVFPSERAFSFDTVKEISLLSRA
jgi:hypothetical protein